MKKTSFNYRQSLFVILAIVWSNLTIAQVNSGGEYSTQNHQKQIIGYITNWDAWKDGSHGLPAKGVLNHLNIDYSQYTILNFSFFGVANDGSLHSGDYRSKKIHETGAVQTPQPLLHTDIFSSWDLHILLGELEVVNWINAAAKSKAQAQGFVVEEGSNTWDHPDWGLYKQSLPLPLKKEGGAKGLLDLAHEKGVKVMASLGGWSMSKHFPEMAADPQKRQKFLADCERLIRIGFDGIDLDWEFPGPFSGMNFTGSEADYQNLTTLVTELRTRLNSIGKGKLLTIALSGDPAKLKNIEWNKLDPLVDHFGIFGYDYNGGWSNIAGHNTPLYNYTKAEYKNFNWHSTVQTLIQLGVPKHKINMGVATYGRGVVTKSPATIGAPTKKVKKFLLPDGDVLTAADFDNWPKFDGTPLYYYIVQQALKPGSGWTKHWDDEAKVPYLTKGNYFLSYDDQKSTEHKAQYIKEQELGGVIVWQVYGDLQMSGSVTSKGSHLKYVANTKAPLVNTLNRVFASGSGNSENKAPNVMLTQPTNQTQYEFQEKIHIKANATDLDGQISKVTFYAGNQLLSEDSNFPYEFQWINAPQGTHEIKAIAIDNLGKTSTPSITTITVKEDMVPNISILITSPKKEQIFQQNQIISIKTKTNGISNGMKVVFYANEQRLGEDTTAPYEFNWNNALTGNHTLQVTIVDQNDKVVANAQVKVKVQQNNIGGGCDGISAWDANKVYAKPGNIVSYEGKKYRNKWWTKGNSPTQVAIANPWELLGNCEGGINQSPTASITSPTNNSSFDLNSTIVIKANAQDSDGNITKVKFYAGNILLGEDTVAPYEFTWNNASVGTHALKVIAEDNQGASATSENVSISIQNGQVPNVMITAPVNGTNIKEDETIVIKTDATDPDGSIAKVIFYAGTQKLGEVTTAPYEFTWNSAPTGNHQLTVVAFDNEGLNTTSQKVFVTVGNSTGNSLPQNIVVGYWHNWNASVAPYITLKDVPVGYNVICVAFAIPVSHSDMTMQFTPADVSKEEFIKDIKATQQRGTKVLISIGGANAPVELKTDEDRQKFVTSMRNIIQEYGFDGMDIDLEGSSVILNPGDTDFKNPTTPKIKNLISATRTLCNEFGNNFILSAAPEVQYLQGGFANYGTAFGGYLPVIHALRDKLTYVHPQLYNTGTQFGMDNQIYGQSTADFMVAMTEMLVQGFPVGRNASNVFPPLREDQVAIGLPAKPAAAPAGGYLQPGEVHKALDYLMKGKSFDGSKYVLRKGTGYPNLRGLMTWSINWDKTNNYEFVNNHHSYFNGKQIAGTTAQTNLIQVKSFPNPTKEVANISIETTESAVTSVSVFNREGHKVIKVCENKMLEKGKHQFRLNLKDLPQGTYFCTVIRQGTIVKTIKVIKK